jgi:hypothetical protein
VDVLLLFLLQRYVWQLQHECACHCKEQQASALTGGGREGRWLCPFPMFLTLGFSPIIPAEGSGFMRCALFSAYMKLSC